MAEIPHLNQVKQDLFQIFRKQRLDQDLKAHMRTQLLNRIKGVHQVKGEDLNFRIICSLFMDFLQANNFRYTPSVFVPECGNSDKILSQIEIAQILDSPLPSSGSLLNDMIETFKKVHQRPHLLDSASQTEDEAMLASLEERLRKIDTEYIRKTKMEADPGTFEEKMLRYQREVDRRMREELQAEVQRIREVEISSVRIEEGNKYRQMLQQYRSEQDNQWKQQLQQLKEREKDLRERIAQREKEIDNREYSHRQQVLKEMEALKQRENELKRAVEVEIKAAKLEKEQWESKKIETENRLKDLEQQKINLDNQLQEEMQRFRRNLESEVQSERFQLMQEKAAAETLRKTLEGESQRMMQTEQDNVKTLSNYKDCRIQLETIEKKYQKLQQEHQEVKDQMKIVSDTSRRDIDLLTVKEQEVQSLRNELQVLQNLLNQQIQTHKESDEQHRILINQLSLQIQGQNQYGKSHLPSGKYDDDYLYSRRSVWKQLEQEEESIKRGFRDLMNPPPAQYNTDPFGELHIPNRAPIQGSNHYSPRSPIRTPSPPKNQPKKTKVPKPQPKPSPQAEIKTQIVYEQSNSDKTISDENLLQSEEVASQSDEFEQYKQRQEVRNIFEDKQSESGQTYSEDDDWF